MKIILCLLISLGVQAKEYKLNSPSNDLLELVQQFKSKVTESDQTKFLTSLGSHKYQNYLQYLQAQNLKTTNKALSCKLFSSLSKNNFFPFSKLSKLRTHEVCSNKSSLNKQELKPWMKKAFMELTIKNCTGISNANCIDTLLRKSKQKLPYTEKVKYTELALTKAKNLNDKKLIQRITRRLEEISPSNKKNITKKFYLTIAEDYKKKRAFTQAHKYYNKVLQGNFSIYNKVKAYRGIGKSYKLARQYKKYVNEYNKLHKYIVTTYAKNNKLISPKLYHKSCLDSSRATWSYSSRTKAIKILSNCIKVLTNKHSLAELQWVLGRIEEEKHNYKNAIAWFKKAQKEKIKTAKLKEKIIWYTAWNERKLKSYPQAIKSFNQLIKITKNPFAKAKFQFWLAKTLLDTNQSSKANKVFQNIIYQLPMSYYSLLSHKFLNKKISFKVDSNKNSIDNIELKQKLNLAFVDYLVLLKENDLAKSYIKSKVQKHRKRFADKDYKLVYNYYSKLELYLEFFYLVSIISPERQIKLLGNNPEFLFPQPYKKLVAKISKKFDFSSNIIYSIMRQESAFDPKARSFADAFGLLQLIPKVAKKANQSVNNNYKKTEDLFIPSINIELGTYYLKNQWDLYQQQFILATASYNATDKAIQSWVKTRYSGDPITFIEDVPYEETRNYIKLVMRNYIFYKLVNSKGSIDFPDYCLNMDNKKT